jgi:ubiquitin carboxyl-terminal hydrolase 25
LYRRKSTI